MVLAGTPLRFTSSASVNLSTKSLPKPWRAPCFWRQIYASVGGTTDGTRWGHVRVDDQFDERSNCRWLHENPVNAVHSSGVASCHTQNEAPRAPACWLAPRNSEISAPLGDAVRPPLPAKLKASPMTCTGRRVWRRAMSCVASLPGSTHSQYTIGANASTYGAIAW